jgi:sugar phosphate isomerase/epimerase
MANLPIAVQLYSVRDDCARDLAGVLEQVAKMGYVGVEFAGYYGNDAPTLRKMLDDNGLAVAGCHVGIETLLGDELKKSIEFHRAIGNRHLIVPGFPESYRTSTDAWRATAETMNDISDGLLPHGMRTGYHNHDIEFKPFEPGGELPWDTFFGNTDPAVIMQFDTGNALHGGSEALPFLQRYPGRAVTVHLKEYSRTNPSALIGEGDVPFAAIFDVCESTGGTEWYIVEQESYAYPPLECIDRCLKHLHSIGK